MVWYGGCGKLTQQRSLGATYTTTTTTTTTTNTTIWPTPRGWLCAGYFWVRVVVVVVCVCVCVSVRVCVRARKGGGVKSV